MAVDAESVVHETVDGEVILIALQTGCYYSLEGSGAEVWAGLLAGGSAAEIAAALEHRYEAPPGTIAGAVADLVESLVAERLVAPAQNGAVAPPSTNGAPSPERMPFPPPVLHKFTDMQDFLLVDPIHEVGESGWPHPAPAAR